MPGRPIRDSIKTILLIVFLSTAVNTVELKSSEGISVYYVRYDIKSANNKIIDEHLLMVPSADEFRAENFSQFTTKGVIFALPSDSDPVVEKQIKEDAIKSILVKNGLKSVASKDYETVISYEGAVRTPLKINQKNYDTGQKAYKYMVDMEFCAVSFPDRWEGMNMKYRLKKMVHEFFELFK